MKETGTIVAILCSLVFATTAFAENKAYVVYGKSADAHEAATMEGIKASGTVSSVVSLINEKFRLTQPLGIIFGGNEDPCFDPELNKILISYKYIEEIEDRFKADNYTETGVSIADATMDTLMHTILHEFAHALMCMYDLPIAGKEEDAADTLATVLLIEFFDDGQEIVLSTADLFDLVSTDADEYMEENFWDEHSLNAQRFYSTLCLVYGSDPAEYAYLPKEVGVSEEKREFCIEEYEVIFRNWFVLLDPYVVRQNRALLAVY